MWFNLVLTLVTDITSPSNNIHDRVQGILVRRGMTMCNSVATCITQHQMIPQCRMEMYRGCAKSVAIHFIKSNLHKPSSTTCKR